MPKVRKSPAFIRALKYKNIDNFTSNTGQKIRRVINPLIRVILKLGSSKKFIIESYPELQKDEPYIFASTHSFKEDAEAALSAIDRNAYVLFGSTDQLDHNPLMTIAWANGLIYVDRQDEKNRKSALTKMEIVLKRGSSILLFPEGVLNNSENLLLQRLFSGVYTIARKTGCKVVPISSFSESASKEAYIRVGTPLDFSEINKDDALSELSEALATMIWQHIENHSTSIRREDLLEEYRIDFMEERRQAYLCTAWTRDVWDEELIVFTDKTITYSDDVWKVFDNVKITNENANVVVPTVLKRIEERYYSKLYDFKSYMKKHWDK
jgi:1-acyl-sn-glycerol-3-phosphate acyltransferase